MQTTYKQQIRDNTALCPLGQNLSRRWKHAENEVVISGKLGRGTLASCFHATTKAIRPEVAGSVKHKALTVKSLAKVAAFYERYAETVKPEKIVACEFGSFDENEHAIKVANVTIAAQKRLEKVFKGARVKVKRQIALKRKETTKGEVLQLKDIAPIPDFKIRVPEFLSREPKTEVGPYLERSEKVERLTFTKPSSGGRAGRVERWGE